MHAGGLRLLAGVVAFLLFVANSSLRADPPYVPPGTSEDPFVDLPTLTKLRSWIVDVRWKSIDVTTALIDLTQKSREADPNHRGIEFALKLAPRHPSTTAQRVAVHRHISILILKQPIIEILGYLCQQTDLNLRVRRNRVSLLP